MLKATVNYQVTTPQTPFSISDAMRFTYSAFQRTGYAPCHYWPRYDDYLLILIRGADAPDAYA